MTPEARLTELLKRREKYFLLEAFQRKIYRTEFEDMQKEILSLKLILEIYEDVLDLLVVDFDYMASEGKIWCKRLEDANELREIKWLKKTYNPQDGKARYIGQVKKEITDLQLQELYKTQVLKREGLIDCPWPTKIE
jgi:hypothetical protein